MCRGGGGTHKRKISSEKKKKGQLDGRSHGRPRHIRLRLNVGYPGGCGAELSLKICGRHVWLGDT